METEGGACWEVDFRVMVHHVQASGDGWNEPREPAHVELDGPEPYRVTIYHPDSEYTELTFQRGSLMYRFFVAVLDRLDLDTLLDCLPEQADRYEPY